MRFALLAAGLMTAFPAAAQNAMPPAMPVGWSAEAKGRDDVTNRLNLPCIFNRLEANLRLSAPILRTKVVPTTGLEFIAPGSAVEKVMLHIRDNGDGKPELVLRKYGGAKAIDDIRFPVAVAYGSDVAVAISWDAAGQITVTAGTAQQRMTLGAVPAAIEFFVQGGKGDVSNARYSWQGPAKPPCPAPR